MAIRALPTPTSSLSHIRPAITPKPVSLERLRHVGMSPLFPVATSSASRCRSHPMNLQNPSIERALAACQAIDDRPYEPLLPIADKHKD